MNTKKIKVYVTCFWTDDTSLYNQLIRYNNKSPVWKNIQLIDAGSYDLAIVLTLPNLNNRLYFTEKFITLFTEPPQSPHHRNSPDRSIANKSYLYLGSYTYNRITLNKATKIGIIKSKLFSSVTSELSWLEGHVERLKFIYYLDKIINKGFDLFGKKYTGNLFKLIGAYRGELKDKFDGLFPYEYHFACENSFIPDYFTEKIADPIMAETLCFYDGCTNIQEFIDDRAFIKLNISNLELSAETIIKSIQDDEYKKRLKHIIQQKKRMLTHLNPLNIIWAAANGKDVLSYSKL